MSDFSTLATEFGSGVMLYDQADIVGRGADRQSSLNNYYLRANIRNAAGVCLGLCIAFLLYSRRFSNRQPMIWIDQFLTESRAAYYETRGIRSVGEVQMLAASVQNDQRLFGNPTQAITQIAHEGMWGVALHTTGSWITRWHAGDICPLIFESLDEKNVFWIIAVHKFHGGGHAMCLRNMIHPRTGSRLLIFFEPNFGVVQFQGITAGAQFKKFLTGFIADEGNIYAGNCELYKFI